MTLTLDLTMLLVMFFAFVAGAACGLAYLLLESAGAFIFGIIFAIAGNHKVDTSGTKRNKGHLLVRMVVYLALCVGSFFLVSAGHPVWAYICGIVGAFCFPVAVFKALERS